MNKRVVLAGASVTVVVVTALVHFAGRGGKPQAPPMPHPGKPVQEIDPRAYLTMVESLRQANADIAILEGEVARIRAAAGQASTPTTQALPSVAKEVPRANGFDESPDWCALPLGPEGPTLDEGLVQTLDLQPGQVQIMENTLRAVYRDYLALEARHTEKRRDEHGVLHVTVSPFPKEGRLLQQQLWSSLDGCLNERQRAVARRHLPLDEAFFSFGESACELEVSKQDDGYKGKHSTSGHMGEAHVRDIEHLPWKYRRFLEEQP